jgi:hypothetical protein
MSNAPSSGSQLAKRTAAGVSASSGSRTRAHRWFSADTPSQAFGSTAGIHGALRTSSWSHQPCSAAASIQATR